MITTLIRFVGLAGSELSVLDNVIVTIEQPGNLPALVIKSGDSWRQHLSKDKLTDESPYIDSLLTSFIKKWVIDTFGFEIGAFVTWRLKSFHKYPKLAIDNLNDLSFPVAIAITLGLMEEESLKVFALGGLKWATGEILKAKLPKNRLFNTMDELKIIGNFDDNAQQNYSNFHDSIIALLGESFNEKKKELLWRASSSIYVSPSPLSRTDRVILNRLKVLVEQGEYDESFRLWEQYKDAITSERNRGLGEILVARAYSAKNSKNVADKIFRELANSRSYANDLNFKARVLIEQAAHEESFKQNETARKLLEEVSKFIPYVTDPIVICDYKYVSGRNEYYAGNFKESLSQLQDAYELAIRQRDDTRTANVLNAAGKVFADTYDFQSALELFAESYLLKQINAMESSIEALWSIADVLLKVGLANDAYEIYVRNQKFLEGYGKGHRETGRILNYTGNSLLAMGRYKEALALFERTANDYVHENRPRDYSFSMKGILRVLYEMESVRRHSYQNRMKGFIDRVVNRNRAYKDFDHRFSVMFDHFSSDQWDPYGLGFVYFYAGLMARLNGDHDEAHTRLSEAAEIFESDKYYFEQGLCLAWSAVLFYESGDATKGSSELEECIRVMKDFARDNGGFRDRYFVKELPEGNRRASTFASLFPEYKRKIDNLNDSDFYFGNTNDSPTMLSRTIDKLIVASKNDSPEKTAFAIKYLLSKIVPP